MSSQAKIAFFIYCQLASSKQSWWTFFVAFPTSSLVTFFTLCLISLLIFEISGWDRISSSMIYPLDTKKLKSQQPNKLIFCKHQYFSQFFSKKAKITKSLFMKNSRNNYIILGFSNWFYVFGLDPIGRSQHSDL